VYVLWCCARGVVRYGLVKQKVEEKFNFTRVCVRARGQGLERGKGSEGSPHSTYLQASVGLYYVKAVTAKELPRN
jgi:hypothetical protein